jgi:hypothetical protein
MKRRTLSSPLTSRLNDPRRSRTPGLTSALASLALAGLTACAGTPREPAEQETGGDTGSGEGGKGEATGGKTTGGTGGKSTGGTGGKSATGGTGGGATGGTGGTETGTGGATSTGGSGGSSSGPDAGMDAPVTTTPPAGAGCEGVTAKFCDDWEKGEAGKAPTGDFTIEGAGITVDTAQHFSGTKSIHVKSSGKTMLNFKKQFPLADLHGRMMMYMPKKPTTGAHWDIVQSVSGNYHWELGGQNRVFELVVDPPDDGIDSPTSFPEGDKWYCLQWNFKSGANVYSAKLDGQFVKPSPVMNRWKTAGAFSNLTVGWEIFGNAAVDYWIDDLAFGDQEIPCPTK